MNGKQAGTCTATLDYEPWHRWVSNRRCVHPDGHPDTHLCFDDDGSPFPFSDVFAESGASGCYCACHSPISSRPGCEHCKGDNPVGATLRCGAPDPSNGNGGLCARTLPCPEHDTPTLVCTVIVDASQDIDVAARCGKPAVRRLPGDLDFPVCAEHSAMFSPDHSAPADGCTCPWDHVDECVDVDDDCPVHGTRSGWQDEG